MKRIVSAVLLCSVISGVGAAQSGGPAQCSPASFRGLKVGKSTRGDVLRTLGNPEARAREEDTGTPYWSYTVGDPAPGWLMVFIRKGHLTGITIVLKTPLNRDRIIGLYGPSLLTVHYDFEGCLGSGGAGPVYVSQNGPIENWEYRGAGKGLVISVHDGLAQEIVFECGPEGPSHSRCGSHMQGSHR